MTKQKVLSSRFYHFVKNNEFFDFDIFKQRIDQISQAHHRYTAWEEAEEIVNNLLKLKNGELVEGFWQEIADSKRLYSDKMRLTILSRKFRLRKCVETVLEQGHPCDKDICLLSYRAFIHLGDVKKDTTWLICKYTSYDPLREEFYGLILNKRVEYLVSEEVFNELVENKIITNKVSISGEDICANYRKLSLRKRMKVSYE